MKKILIISFLVSTAALLSACGNSDGMFGSKPAPDEFAVYSRAPLSLPPDFSIRPPEEGAQRPQELVTRDSAKDAIRASSRARRIKTQAGGSPGLTALLKETGGLEADPKIRATIRKEMSDETQGDAGFTERLLKWTSKKGKKAGVVIDPESEAQRIKAMQSKDGGAVSSEAPLAAPTITRDSAPKEKGFWGSMF